MELGVSFLVKNSGKKIGPFVSPSSRLMMRYFNEVVHILLDQNLVAYLNEGGNRDV